MVNTRKELDEFFANAPRPFENPLRPLTKAEKAIMADEPDPLQPPEETS